MPLPLIQKVLVGKNLVEMTRFNNGINKPRNFEFTEGVENSSPAEKNDSAESRVSKNDLAFNDKQPSDSDSDSDVNFVYSPVKKI